MSHNIETLKEISDSKEILEAKPFPYMYVFIYIVFFLILGCLMWCYFGEVEEVVKAQGVVRPNNSISVIRNIVTGKVNKLNMKEGQVVRKGDILYTLDSKDINYRLKNSQDLMKRNKIDYDNLLKMRKSILQKENLFDVNNIDEKDNYYKYEKYRLDLQEQFENNKNITEEINSLENKINKYNLLLKCIEDEVNYFDRQDQQYYVMYESYNIKEKELKDDVNYNKNEYSRNKILYESGIISKKEFEKVEHNFSKSILDLEKFRNETKSQLLSQIFDNNLLVNKKKSEKNKLLRNTNIDNHNLSYFELNTIVAIDDNIKKIHAEIQNLETEIKQLNYKRKQYIIKSPINGVLQIEKGFNIGDKLLQEETIAIIIPKQQRIFKVNINVSNQDISKIKKGDIVKYHFKALPFKEYGELQGKIIKISEDTNSNERSYLLEGSLENKPLYGYDGNVGKIKIGMITDAQVVINRKRIIYYLLEKLDMRN